MKLQKIVNGKKFAISLFRDNDTNKWYGFLVPEGDTPRAQLPLQAGLTRLDATAITLQWARSQIQQYLKQ